MTVCRQILDNWCLEMCGINSRQSPRCGYDGAAWWFAGMARFWLVRPRPDVRRLGIRLGWSFRSKTVLLETSASQHTYTRYWRLRGHPSIPHTDYYYRSRLQRIAASAPQSWNVQDHRTDTLFFGVCNFVSRRLFWTSGYAAMSKYTEICIGVRVLLCDSSALP